MLEGRCKNAEYDHSLHTWAAVQNQLEDKTSANTELLAITWYEMDGHSKYVNSNEYNIPIPEGSTRGASRWLSGYQRSSDFPLAPVV
jgi:hypothetical protein